MPALKPESEKKKALLAHKEKLLQNIKYYEKRIEELQANASSKTYFEDSSDSEDDLPMTVDTGPSVVQLRTEQAMLRTCSQATQELMSLQVLESGYNVMVEDPVIEGEPPVAEPGLWREVTAECRIDLVPFSIMFLVHQPNRLFPPKWFRSLKVQLVKAAHEAELAGSVLPTVKRPSDAVEVLRSYAAAYRSRRTTLSKLADKYAQNLFMEPMTDGGFLLKCANLLEVSWHLENKRSPLASFHHRMKFELEYMDESYIKIITQAHKQLSDPTINTDQRTLLLAKIISTCLEAQGPTQDLYESMESDPESIKILEKRRTTLDQDVEHPVAKKKRGGSNKNDEKERDKARARDDEIMAPPKTLPKKVKPKGKENTDQNRKSVKRSNTDEGTSNVKKAKTDPKDIRQMVNELDKGSRDENGVESGKKAKSDDRNQNEANPANEAYTDKTNAEATTSQKNTQKEQAKDTEKAKIMKKSKNNDPTNNVQEKTKHNNKEKHTDAQEKTGNQNEIQEKTKKTTKITGPQKVTKDKIVTSTKNIPKAKGSESQKVTNNNVATSKNDAKTKDSEAEGVANGDDNIISAENIPKSDENVAEKNAVKAKNIVTNKPTDKNVPKKPTGVSSKPETSKVNDKKFSIDKAKKQNVKVIQKNSTENRVSNEKNKLHTDVKSANTKTKINTNKGSSIQNSKTVVANPDPNKKIKSTTEIATNKNKDLPKNGAANKPEVTSTKNLNNLKNSDRNSERGPNNKVSQINNIQKAKAVINNVKESKITTNKAKNLPKNANVQNKIANSEENTVEKIAKVKNVAIANKEHIADRTDVQSTASIKKPNPKIADGTKNSQRMVIKNLSHKNPSTQKNLPKNAKTSNTAKNVNTGNTKENGAGTKISKIPQKKLSPISESAIKRNPLRISPRKIPSGLKSISDSNLKQKIFTKRITNIPRLMKKPERKLK